MQINGRNFCLLLPDAQEQFWTIDFVSLQSFVYIFLSLYLSLYLSQFIHNMDKMNKMFVDIFDGQFCSHFLFLLYPLCCFCTNNNHAKCTNRLFYGWSPHLRACENWQKQQTNNVRIDATDSSSISHSLEIANHSAPKTLELLYYMSAGTFNAKRSRYICTS